MTDDAAHSLESEAVGAMSLVDALIHQAASRPDQPALRTVGGDDGTSDVSYLDLATRARTIAVRLTEHCRPGDRILLLVSQGPDFVSAFFGCLFAGTVPVPLAARINRGVAAVIGRIMADADARVMIISRDVADSGSLAALLPGQRFTVLEAEAVAAGPADWKHPGTGRDDLAFLQYTSGTTSAPKGVMVTHGNLLHNMRSIRDAFGFSTDSVMASWLPPHHDMGLIGTMLTPIYLGVPTVLMDPLSFIRRPARWLNVITRYGATISGGPNFAYDLCTRRVTETEKAELDLSRWRVAFNGAEPVQARTMRAFAASFASAGFDASAFLACYGLAEATLLVAGRAGAHGTADPDPVTDLVACGTLPEIEVLVVDQAGQVAEDGAIGEIWVGGASVAEGYWNKPDESRDAFGNHIRDWSAQAPAGPYLRTGDLGFRIDDRLYVRGRSKDTVVVRGQNHYPADLEVTLRDHCASITGRIAVFGVPGPEGEALAAWYETKAGTAAETADSTAAAGRRAIAQVHGVELYQIIAVPQGTIPVTTSGKIRRVDCAKAYLAGDYQMLADDPLRPAGDQRGLVGQLGQVRGIVARLLDIAPEVVDESCTPAELGIDSLAAVELQHAFEMAFGTRPPLRDVLGDRSLAELFAAARAAPPAHDPPAHAPGPEGFLPDGTSFPLSQNQRVTWLQRRLAATPASLNLSRAVTISGELNTTALAAAFSDIGQRHPALRTAYSEADGELTQHIVGDAPVILEVRDTAGWSRQQLDEMIEAEAAQPFDAPPLLRVVIYQRAPDRHVLQVSAHHSVMDVQSLVLVIQDLVDRMAAHASGVARVLEPGAARVLEPGAHPVVFVGWQRSFTESEEGRRLAAEWRAELAATARLQLPTDWARPATPAFRGAVHYFLLDRVRHARVVALAAGCGVSASAVLFAAYAAVLARFSGQQSFSLGFVHAGRVRADFAGLVSCLANPLPIGIEVRTEADFRSFAHAVSAGVLAASDRAAIPFGTLIGSSGQAGGGAAYLSATFALQHSPGMRRLGLAPLVLNHPGRLRDWAGLGVESYPVPQTASYFDLSLYCCEHEGELLAALEYNTETYDRKTAEVLAEVFSTLLAAACSAPRTLVAELPALSAARQARAVREPDTTARHDTDVCVHQLIEQQAHRIPAATAVIGDDQRLTFAELNESANRLAHRLIRLGAAPGVPVGILLPRSPTSLIAVLAVLKSGAAYVPLDPFYPRQRLEFMMADSAAPLLIAAAEQAAGFPRATVVDPADPSLAGEPAEDPPPRALPDQLAYIVYTSGSTGTPQGVLGVHRAITIRQRRLLDRFPFAPDEVGSHKTSLAFFDSAGEMFLPLCAGIPVVVIAEDVGRDPVRLADTLAAHRVTRLVAVPSLLASILDSVPDVGRRLAGLRFCHSSGEKLPADVARRWLSALPGCALINLYGSSETPTADVALDVITDSTQVASVGRPICDAQIHVLDERLRPLPPRFPGEIYVGGVSLPHGYLGRPDLTAAKFVPDPFGMSTGRRLFRTWDRGRWRHDGRLECLGRVDHQVKIRGFRIELGEVEAALRAHPGVREAAAAVADLPEGNRQQLIAAVVAHPEYLSGLASRADASAADRVADWRQLYDRVYADAGVAEEAQFRVWTSSYTGAPFTVPELTEWTDQAVIRIRDLRPRELLEIGCGTGNLVLALAPECERYVGTDFSAAGLEILRERLTSAGVHAELLLSDADDLSGCAARSFDTVVLNSVAQYFPGHDYLLAVLRAAVDRTRADGRIFVGDVRDLDLLEPFHISVALAHADATGVTAGDVRDLVARRLGEEEELALSQDFFESLPRSLPRVSRVSTLVKRGRQVNELSAFRYDVVLHVEEQAPVETVAPRVLDWHEDALDLAELRARLREDRSRPVEVRGVPNARLARIRAEVEWLRRQRENTAVRGVIEPPETALDPEDAWAIGQAANRHTEVVPAGSPDPYAMDLRFWPAAAPSTHVDWRTPDARQREWGQLANEPLRTAARRRLLSEIRAELRQRLPEFMVPVLDLVDQLPATPSGKVDRLAISGARSPRQGGAEKPRAPLMMPAAGLEAVVSEIWRETLAVGAFGLDDNFFDLGGNSLSLVEVHIRLKDLVEREFPLVDLYEHTTVRKVAAFLGSPPEAWTEAPAPADREESRQRSARVADRRDWMRERRQES